MEDPKYEDHKAEHHKDEEGHDPSWPRDPGEIYARGVRLPLTATEVHELVSALKFRKTRAGELLDDLICGHARTALKLRISSVSRLLAFLSKAKLQQPIWLDEARRRHLSRSEVITEVEPAADDAPGVEW